MNKPPLFDPKGSKFLEERIFYSFPKTEPRDRETGIPEIQSPFQLAVGKFPLVTKRSLFIHLATFEIGEKSISARGIFALVHVFCFNLTKYKIAAYFRLQHYIFQGICYKIHTSPANCSK
jgi:hypothetical protein